MEEKMARNWVRMAAASPEICRNSVTIASPSSSRKGRVRPPLVQGEGA